MMNDEYAGVITRPGSESGMTGRVQRKIDLVPYSYCLKIRLHWDKIK